MDIDTPIIAAFILFFIAGMFDGTAETLKWHPSGFFHVFRNANPAYWDTAISWKNKYKNGDPAQGAKFWLSTTALVAFTDGYHLARLIKNNLTFLAAMCFFAVALIAGSPVLWYHFPVAFALCYLAYTVGFSVVYEWLFGYK